MDLPRQTSASRTDAANVLCSFSPSVSSQPASIPRPSGPAPKNSIWDSVMGCWVKKVNKNKLPQIIFKFDNDTDKKIQSYPCPYPRKSGHTWNSNTGKWIKNTGPPYSCPYPRKSGHIWNSNTGKWIKNNEKVVARKMAPNPKKVIQKKEGASYSHMAERTRTQTRKADDTTNSNYKNAVRNSSWNPKWGPLTAPSPRNSVSSVSNDSKSSMPTPATSADQKTDNVKEESLHKLNKSHVKILLPSSVLARYNGEDGNWLSRGTITKIIIDWDDGDTKHTIVDANEVYYNPQ
jgi:hypothetical protein